MKCGDLGVRTEIEVREIPAPPIVLCSGPLGQLAPRHCERTSQQLRSWSRCSVLGWECSWRTRGWAVAAGVVARTVAGGQSLGEYYTALEELHMMAASEERHCAQARS